MPCTAEHLDNRAADLDGRIFQSRANTIHMGRSKPCERRARVFRGNDAPALELTLWFSPLGLPGLDIHLMIRVEEADPRRRDD